MNIEVESNLIERFLHTTTQPFDSWDWDGNELLIFLQNEIIERYSLNDLKTIIKDFE